MKAVLLLAVLVAAALAKTESEYQQSWFDFKAKYSKSYDSFALETTRYNIFKANLDYINQFNAEEHTYTLAVNSFADMTNEEFRAVFLSTPMPLRSGKSHGHSANVGALPASWDWNAKGAVTAIKNQGQCGSCWSFSTTGSVEGCIFIASGKLQGLSEQNLMDCSYTQGNEACNGGLMDDAFKYIITNKGLDTEASYPYTAESSTTCNYNAANSGGYVTGYVDVTSGDENALQAAVYIEPVSIAIDASQSSFQFYSTGVYSDPNCSSTQLDHGVLAIGWGTSSGTAYWIVKNSWGTDWGQNGFIWMARNDNNMCGVATMASYPTGCVYA
jgi:cathepsin L